MPSGQAGPALEGDNWGRRVRQGLWVQKVQEGDAMGSAATMGKPEGLTASLPRAGTQGPGSLWRIE